jgi:hypothetical protein
LKRLPLMPVPIRELMKMLDQKSWLSSTKYSLLMLLYHD